MPMLSSFWPALMASPFAALCPLAAPGWPLGGARYRVRPGPSLRGSRASNLPANACRGRPGSRRGPPLEPGPGTDLAPALRAPLASLRPAAGGARPHRARRPTRCTRCRGPACSCGLCPSGAAPVRRGAPAPLAECRATMLCCSATPCDVVHRICDCRTACQDMWHGADPGT